MSGLYDWQDSGNSTGLRVSVWVNNSNVGGAQQGTSSQGPPDVERWSQPVSLAGASQPRADFIP